MREIAVPTIQKPAKVDPTADKKALRLSNLTRDYEIIRGKPINCATQVRLNYVEPPVVEEERPPSPKPDPKAKPAPKKK
jgi:hypothetical protein